MNNQDAINLVRQTFEKPFDEPQYQKFISFLLQDLQLAPFNLSGNYIPDAFNRYVSSYKRLGKYFDPAGRRLDVLVVYLHRTLSVERARATQRQFVAGYLQGKYGSTTEKEAALVAFVSKENPADWRFSLVKLETKLETTPQGKLKPVDEFTSARRWSFLVGPHEKSHTAQAQFIPLLTQTPSKKPTFAQLEEAFNIEKVTKEFFVKYRGLFIKTKEALDQAMLDNPKVQQDFEAKGVDTVNLAKKLLGQIVFLYYLQKKGWFGVPRDGAWGDGSKQFLRELFEQKHGSYHNFFNDILESLFYEALSNDRSYSNHYYSRFNCRIPFLNGGLFDPMHNYDWVNTDILLPNILFSNQHKTAEGDIGDGILDIFDRYNFTVKEDEPFEKEVAIDPELLGKAYEKFNAIRPDNYDEFVRVLNSGKKGEENKFNKQYGVYYTPREIVHYMCQQSLINYLHHEVNATLNAQRPESNQTEWVTKEELTNLIEHGESWREHDERVENKGRETDDYRYQSPAAVRTHASLIDQKLQEMTVCDPAVGSGAFPVGMMNEIVRTRELLQRWTNLPHTSYELKRTCIEHSLYGVDIDAGAVEIAKLRLWLSLIVDEEDIQKIKPLPNLDYKIVCGNTLLNVQKNLFNNHLFEQFKNLKINYFNESNPSNKKKLYEEINSLINQIIGEGNKFDIEIYFSEVFYKEGEKGFDVIIANPPYGADLSQEQKNYLKKRHENIVERIPNTFLYFLGEAYKQTKNNGIITFILPNELLFQIYMTKARGFFLKNAQFIFAINLGEKIFEAIVPTCVVSISKSQKEDYFIGLLDLRNNTLDSITQSLSKHNFFQTTNQKLLTSQNYIFSFDSSKFELVNKLQTKFTAFENFCEDIANGISTSCDEIYIVTKDFAIQHSFEEMYLKECIRGEHFNRFYCPEHTNEYVLYITKDFNPTLGKNIYQYLEENKDLLIKKSVEKREGKRLWHILFRSRTENLFKKPKILFRQTSDKIVAAIDDIVGYYCINSVHVGLVKPEFEDKLNYFIGLLNSKLMVFLYRESSQEQGRVHAEVKPSRIKALPIPHPTTATQIPIETLTHQIISIKQANPQADSSHLEAEIDQLVYQLYGLTEDEIALVEAATKK